MTEAREKPGTMLYLDGVSVAFDGPQAINNLSIIDHPRRNPGHYRPQWRRQDHDVGHHHRQDPPR
ncbi:hypothetical protein [Devosia ginsengisoli]|uniref:hypothetical protein n=1 Tax=Devosia ginsengisoli TaxID=400770 RepID=UPI0034E94F33